MRTFWQWLETNNPYFNLRPGWKDTGFSDDPEGQEIGKAQGFHGNMKTGLQPLGGSKMGDPKWFAPVWASFPQDQVKFVVNEVCDQLMKEFEQEGEHEGFNILDVLKWRNVPYYHKSDENDERSIPRDWTHLANEFIKKTLSSHPEVKAALAKTVQANSGKAVTDKHVKNYGDHIFTFLEGYIARELGRRMLEKYSNADFSVQLYGIKRGFGGEEEGGWYYDHNDLLKTIPVKGLFRAFRKYKELERMFHGKGEDSFMKDMASGHGNAREIEDWEYEATGDAGQEGMDIPRGWLPSKYERYEAVLRLVGSDTKETKAPPVYR